jgi:hypothetical protein
MVKENHCLPITNSKWRSYLSRAGELPLQPFQFSSEEVKGAVVIPSGSTLEDCVQRINDTTPETAAVVAPVPSLDEVCAGVMQTTGKIVESSAWVHGNMTMFRHPVTNAIIVAGPDYDKRKEFCDEFYKHNAVEDRRGNLASFANQGWGTIGSEIVRAKYVDLPMSEYPSEYKTILQQYPLGPYRARVTADKLPLSGDKSVDIRRCYSYLLQHMDMDWPVFGPMDFTRMSTEEERSVAGILPGEYYVNRVFTLGKGTIQLSRGWYPSTLIRYARQHDYLTAGDITFVLPASRRIPSNAFTQFCVDTEANYPQVSKEVINMFIGCTGSLYARETRCGFTTDANTAASTVGLIQVRGNVGKTNFCGGVYMVQETTKRMRSRGNVALFRAILGGSYGMLDKVIRIAGFGPEQILSFNTDCVKVRGVATVTGAAENKDSAAWGEYYVEEGEVNLWGRPLNELPMRAAYTPSRPCVSYFFELDASGQPAMGHADEADRLKALNNECDKPLVSVSWVDKLPTGIAFAGENVGALFMGPPGCGKTFLMADLYHALLGIGVDQDSVCVTAYTHAACANLRAKGLPAKVFNSLVWNPTTDKMDAEKLAPFKYLLLDEYTMLPPSEMRVLIDAACRHGFVVWAAGDHLQCCAPVDNPVAYHSNPNFLTMCGSRLYSMAYKEGTGRYDETLRAALEHFQVTSTVAAWQTQKPFEGLCYNNICFTNAKRGQLNKTCLTAWLATQPHGNVVNLKGQGSRVMSVCPGLPVMAYHSHILEHNILKTQRWKIENVDTEEKSIVISCEDRDEPVTLTHAQFLAVFDYCFAVTVHKIQGLTFHSDYVVHELNHRGMSFNVVYTALSRGTTLDHVHLEDVAHWDRVYERQLTDTCTTLDIDKLRPAQQDAILFTVTAINSSTNECVTGAGHALGTGDILHIDSLTEACSQLLCKNLGEDIVDVSSDDISIARRFKVAKHDLALAVFHEWFEHESKTTPTLLNLHAGLACEPTRAVRSKRKRDAETMITEEKEHVVAHPKKRKERFAVKEYPKSNYFRVAYESKHIPLQHRVRNFKYSNGNATSRDAALAKANAWSIDMKSLYC